MISILIPVYNQVVLPLVKDLRKQCEELDIQFQILVFDDKSEEIFKKQNEDLNQEFGINYVELSENLGRAKIRNRLAKTARFDWLLFLDGDSGIIRDDFIKKYLQFISKGSVFYGGRKYQKSKPKDESLVLHWKYGMKREALPLDKRKKDVFLNFQSNNFLIQNELFNSIGFDTEIEGYGYEDLLLAQAIREAGETIIHLDNPILHDGLEENAQFLTKTVNAVENLVSLNQKGKLLNVRLSRFYRTARKNGYISILLLIISWRFEKIRSNLESSSPRLINFTLFKLLKYNEFNSSKRK